MAIGQAAYIYIDGYPVAEYGQIATKLTQIAALPRHGTYTATIELPEVLVTTDKQNIPFRQGMTGTVYIITENKRFIVRLIHAIQLLLPA